MCQHFSCTREPPDGNSLPVMVSQVHSRGDNHYPQLLTYTLHGVKFALSSQHTSAEALSTQPPGSYYPLNFLNTSLPTSDSLLTFPLSKPLSFQVPLPFQTLSMLQSTPEDPLSRAPVQQCLVPLALCSWVLLSPHPFPPLCSLSCTATSLQGPSAMKHCS